MKNIDKLITRAFVPPLLGAFFLVMFILTMQYMWKFIDDIIGKGASVGMIIEFIMYLSIGLIPLALPAAILLSSILVMGNFAERYELTAMKSAGISLWRIMRALIVAASLISVFSFICSNYIAPVANLKFKTRLYNFKSQKLALSLNEGIFNDDFRNFSIRIGEKDDETGEIREITMYDHSIENRNRTKIIVADRGKIDMESDERYMIMELEDGKQYQELEEKNKVKKEPRAYPYSRITFDVLEKYLDLSEFEMKDMEEDLFKDQEQMLSCRQLLYEMDTMQITIADKKNYLSLSTSAYFHFVKTSDSTSYYIPMHKTVDRVMPWSKNNRSKYNNNDKQTVKSTQETKIKPPPKLIRPNKKVKNLHTAEKSTTIKNQVKPPIKKSTITPKEEKIILAKYNGKPATFAEIFLPKHKQDIASRGASSAKGIKDKSISNRNKIKNLIKKKRRYAYEFHLKFSLAVACIIFMFIGAPLGAIIRKGGFGYPIIFGTVLFAFFVVMNTVFKKLGENETITIPFLAAWLPTILYAIPCFLLTRAAIRDATAWNMKTLQTKFSWLKTLTSLFS